MSRPSPLLVLGLAAAKSMKVGRWAWGGLMSKAHLRLETGRMKILGIFAALALMASPTLILAQSANSSSDTDEAAVPESGGVSQAGALPIFGAGAIPAGAVVVGGVVILGGVIVGVVASQDSTVATTGTN